MYKYQRSAGKSYNRIICKKKKKKLHDYPFSCIHSHTSSYYLDLFYKNNIHYSLSSEAHQNSLWKGSDSFEVLIYDCQINYYNSHDTCPTLIMDFVVVPNFAQRTCLIQSSLRMPMHFFEIFATCFIFATVGIIWNSMVTRIPAFFLRPSIEELMSW